jgi:hypothetical protein
MNGKLIDEHPLNSKELICINEDRCQTDQLDTEYEHHLISDLMDSI